RTPSQGWITSYSPETRKLLIGNSLIFRLPTWKVGRHFGRHEKNTWLVLVGFLGDLNWPR
ncbi:MAG: hypothetical protein ACKOBW_01660, partial [Planctomycetota bacterium]